MNQVFISYKRDDDIDFAKKLSKKIEKEGFMPWMDTEIPGGADWREEIDQRIRESFALVVVMTRNAKESEYVTYEWAFAWGAGVPVVPLKLEPVELHPRLEVLQYLDFTEHKLWSKLIKTLKERPQDFAGQQDQLTATDKERIKTATSDLTHLLSCFKHRTIEDIESASGHPILQAYSDLAAKFCDWERVIWSKLDASGHESVMKLHKRIVNVHTPEDLASDMADLLAEINMLATTTNKQQ